MSLAINTQYQEEIKKKSVFSHDFRHLKTDKSVHYLPHSEANRNKAANVFLPSTTTCCK